MPFALGVIGILLIVAGARGTYPQLKDLLVDDFSGDKSFWMWIVALGITGSIGYVPGLERFSRLFMLLIVISMVLAQSRGNRGGFFEKFMSALKELKYSNTTKDSGGGTGLNDWYGGLDKQFFGGTLHRTLPLLKDPGSMFGIGN